jgi:hypothetical protein
MIAVAVAQIVRRVGHAQHLENCVLPSDGHGGQVLTLDDHVAGAKGAHLALGRSDDVDVLPLRRVALHERREAGCFIVGVGESAENSRGWHRKLRDLVLLVPH